MSRFELLAPAGSIESLKAAVNAGADAVYIGGAAFGARAYADNPEEDALIEGIRYCHVRNKKVYLTVNTLFKEDELENRLFSFLRPYYEAGLDAVIVQDIGAVSFINKYFPGLPIHLSTQASVTMAEGAELLKDSFENITRVVPARELSAAELRRFKESTALEIEVFIHGALCYCYSGQCLMSSMIGGRSGNRGRCAQPCRRMYDGKYLLSPKDQCLLPVLHELLDIGIDSFKIEGRMKSPEYTAGVVSVYRRYIDKYDALGSSGYKKWLESNKSILDADMLILQDLYNRGGFNHGYLDQHNGPDMMTFDRPNHTGTEVGEVITVRGREAVIRFKREVFAQDVLEIRDGNKNVFEFTLGQGFVSGSTFSCITMKERKASVGMPVFRTRPNSLLASIRADYIEKISKVPVKIAFKGKLGEEAELTMTGVCTVKICGGVVEPAQKAPSDAASVIKQLSKLGETDLCVDGEIEVELDENVFVPSGELNRMRREAAEELRRKLIERFERRTKDPEDLDKNGLEVPDHKEKKGRIYSVRSEAAFEAVVDTIVSTEAFNAACKSDVSDTYVSTDSIITEIYYNLRDFDTELIDRLAVKLKAVPDINLWLGLPYISRSAVYDRMMSFVQTIMNDYPSIGFIARTREEIYLLKQFGAVYRTDYNLYVMNSRTESLTDTYYTLPQELSFNELQTVATDRSELIIYGSQPVMFSAQCVYKNKTGNCRLIDSKSLNGCDDQSVLFSNNASLTDFVTITDELGHDFHCMQVCDFCYNIIYNSAVLDLRDCKEDIEKLNLRAVRYDFTFESPDEIRAIIAGKPVPSIGPVTHGHFRRGIQ